MAGFSSLREMRRHLTLSSGLPRLTFDEARAAADAAAAAAAADGGGGAGGSSLGASAAASAAAEAAGGGEQQGAAEAPKVLLRFRLPEDKQEVKLKIPSSAALQQAMDKFAELAVERGWAPAGSRLRFEFDGERLEGGETAAGLEMEDGDLLDVRVI